MILAHLQEADLQVLAYAESYEFLDIAIVASLFKFTIEFKHS